MRKHTDRRWAQLGDIRGLRVVASQGELSRAVKDAALLRNPNNWTYQPVGQVTPPFDEDEYGRRDDLLHQKVKTAARAYFKGMRVDDNYPKGCGGDVAFLRAVGTPFTYQNEDWHQPTYECHIGVLLPYISSRLLLAFQQLLTAEFEGWCIVVGLCHDASFGYSDHVYLFSDQAFVRQDVANLLQLPSKCGHDGQGK